MNQIERIARMERILCEAAPAVQALMAALERYRAVLPDLDVLEAYYVSPQWMQDYEDDCAGRLPGDLRRGVLSEDAVYDLLSAKKTVCDLMEAAAAESAQ